VRVLGLQLVADLDVKIASVLLIRHVLQNTSDLFASVYCKNIPQIEDGLFPMRVLGMWSSGELDWLVACGELDVEPGDDGVNEVAAAHIECEGNGEGQVFWLDSVEVEGYDGCRIGDDGFHIDGINEGFGHGCGFERSVVKAPYVVPDCAKSVNALEERYS
jgi:hypothetical protein